MSEDSTDSDLDPSPESAPAALIVGLLETMGGGMGAATCCGFRSGYSEASSCSESFTSRIQDEGGGAEGHPHVSADSSMSDCSSGNTARVMASMGEKGGGAPGVGGGQGGGMG